MTKREFIESLYWPLIILVAFTTILTGVFGAWVVVGFWALAGKGFLQGVLWVIAARSLMWHTSKKLDRVVTHPERVAL